MASGGIGLRKVLHFVHTESGIYVMTTRTTIECYYFDDANSDSQAERSVTFSTTSRTRGIDILNKARDLLELLTLTPVPPLKVNSPISSYLAY